MDKFSALRILQERENKLLETQIQISLKEKGLIYTLDHLIDLHKNPNALHYLYQYMSEDQTAIYNLATFKYSIDAGFEFMYDEGFSAFMPYSYIMLNSIISRLTDGKMTTWPSYEDCIKKHPDLKELIDAFHFSKHKEELMPFYKKRFEYINWYKKYSHIWKSEGLFYADFCSQYDGYPFLNVEVLSISDYIKDVSKYYKFYKLL